MLSCKEVDQALDADKRQELDEFIDGLDTTDGALIAVLHRAQRIFGYLSAELQMYIARRLDIPGAEVFGVVSFYSFFTMKPPGQHTLSVCMGTACFVRGADAILADFKSKLGVTAGETTADGQFTLKDVRCVGACGLAPVVMVDDKVYGRVTTEDVDKIIAAYAPKEGHKHG